jgi:hypothetical protein
MSTAPVLIGKDHHSPREGLLQGGLTILKVLLVLLAHRSPIPVDEHDGAWDVTWDMGSERGGREGIHTLLMSTMAPGM